jgi:hypothetical protein
VEWNGLEWKGINRKPVGINGNGNGWRWINGNGG